MTRYPEMDERPKTGSGFAAVNDRIWVTAAYRGNWLQGGNFVRASFLRKLIRSILAVGDQLRAERSCNHVGRLETLRLGALHVAYMPVKPPFLLPEHAIALARLLARHVARQHHAERCAAGKKSDKTDRTSEA
ncbi:hypothetical protein [Sphingomonas carotinifaciens]|uniref:Uncharacterized protein n=1 Tax=Sphingomonas carotinifaciens TaxID=1166323 RepID=A0A6N8LUY6_9SPHN|nr:hypothetical protein [Sphingomonas carotinifaciens]MBB4088221.1 hypothetical protein [Sphingomonas carotinifaciens]MWC44743.1 hypothetical protein [Sphingomonas carotinifaciens]